MSAVEGTIVGLTPRGLLAPLESMSEADKVLIAGFCEYLAEKVEISLLSDGTRVIDSMDFQKWLQEVADEVRR